MPQIPFKSFWATKDGGATCRLYLGDVLSVLKRLPAKSMHCCVTSPPYWGLRSYATGDSKYLEIGCEKTPDEFVANMVRVFREVRRVLRDDGTLWLNLGDTYAGSTTAGRNDADPVCLNGFTGSSGKYGGIRPGGGKVGGRGANRDGALKSGIPSGNLIGIPWRVALALQADGWILRSDIPWVKRAAMPESVTNRPAKALEYVFMLAKGKGYYYDAEAVRKETQEHRTAGPMNYCGDEDVRERKSQSDSTSGRNFRNTDLWFESVEAPWGVVGVGEEMVGIDITSQGYAGAHFAVFPPRLITPLILAGTSEKGCCGKCGGPWKRILESNGGARVETEDVGERDRSVSRNRNGITGSLDSTPQSRNTVGWGPGCECGADVVPCTVLDPFVGSGTTAATAMGLGRRAVGIDLSRQYLEQNAIPRIYEELTSNPTYRELLSKALPKKVNL